MTRTQKGVATAFISAALSLLLILKLLFGNEEKGTLRPVASVEKKSGSINLPVRDRVRRIVQTSSQFKINKNPALQILEITDLSQLKGRGFLKEWTTTASTTPNDNNKHSKYVLRTPTEQQPWIFTVLGASCSARPANNCHPFSSNAKESAKEGRYSNILERALLLDGFPTNISNMAQGSTTSVWNGVMIDQLVSVQDNTDLLIWDHSVNDFAEDDDRDAPHKMLHFWLTRARIVFQHVRRKPVPPILFLYLWKQDVGLRNKEYILTSGHAHDQHPSYAPSLQILQYHIETYNLQIQVLDVAKLIPSTVFVEQRQLLLDDRHHPACVGARLIATVIQYAIYDHFLMDDKPVASPSNVQSAVFPVTVWQATNSTFSHELLQVSTHLTSFTEWQPRVTSSQPTLHIAPTSLQTAKDLGYLANIFPAADMPGRADRKFAFRLPLCSENYLELVLVEPRLKWLGLVTAGAFIRLQINGKATELSGNGSIVSGLASPVNLPRANYDWVAVYASNMIDKNKNKGMILLELCDSSPRTATVGKNGHPRRMWLHQLIGVRE